MSQGYSRRVVCWWRWGSQHWLSYLLLAISCSPSPARHLLLAISGIQALQMAVNAFSTPWQQCRFIVSLRSSCFHSAAGRKSLNGFNTWNDSWRPRHARKQSRGSRDQKGHVIRRVSITQTHGDSLLVVPTFVMFV